MHFTSYPHGQPDDIERLVDAATARRVMEDQQPVFVGIENFVVHLRWLQAAHDAIVEAVGNADAGQCHIRW